MNISAIIWDYDGTLADSIPKNLAVTMKLLPKVDPLFLKRKLPLALTSVEQYRIANHQATNWRDLYTDHFGLTEEQTEIAHPLWSEYQNRDKTAVELFAGISSVIKEFAHIPQAICSQNCSLTIKSLLTNHQLADHFKAIIGYQDAKHVKPKPHPDRLFYCLDQLGITKQGVVLYIGDHQEDMWFVRDTKMELKKRNLYGIQLLSAAACYSGANPSLWDTPPDYQINSTKELSLISNMLK